MEKALEAAEAADAERNMLDVFSPLPPSIPPAFSPLARQSCPAAQLAEEVLGNLKLCGAARSLLDLPPAQLRGPCADCGREAVLFCARCIQAVVPLPPPVKLGLQVHILRHPGEPASKSSAAALPLLAPEIQSHDLAAPSATEDLCAVATTVGTWLIYPAENAIPTSSVDWSKVSGLVLIDSRWAHAGSVMREHEALARMPAIRLETSVRSVFWRRGFDSDEPQGFVSTAECLWLLLRERARALADPEGPLDDLLIFFALRHRIIAAQYAQDPMGRCCPWCQETARRRLVHGGPSRRKPRPANARDVCFAHDPRHGCVCPDFDVCPKLHLETDIDESVATRFDKSQLAWNALLAKTQHSSIANSTSY